jgi:pyruvyltransferase
MSFLGYTMLNIIIKLLIALIPIKYLRQALRSILKNKLPLKSIFANYKIYYFNSHPNFGDILNKNLMDFFKCNYIHMSPNYANLFCIGSLLELLLSPSRNNKTLTHIFGSGFIKPPENSNEQFGCPVKIHALRGKISKQRCEKILGKKLNIPLGDPGLLTKYFFPKAKNKKTYDVGIVCHYVDTNSPLLKNIKLKKLSFKFIDISLPPSLFIKEMLECGFILSSAMHGLICADSFGIPNKHIILSNNLTGGEYKFNDYYSVFKNFRYQPIYMTKNIITDTDITKFKKQYTITETEITTICKNLIKAFPKIN